MVGWMVKAEIHVLTIDGPQRCPREQQQNNTAFQGFPVIFLVPCHMGTHLHVCFYVLSFFCKAFRKKNYPMIFSSQIFAIAM